MDQMRASVNSNLAKLSILIKLLVGILILNLCFDRATQLIPIYTVGGNFSLWNTLMMSLKLPHFWTGLLVPIIYLFALWSASNFLKHFEEQKRFGDETLHLLQKIGADLMYVAMAAILMVPTIEAWINQGGRGVKTDWDIQTVTIGMIGLILKFVAQRARNLQSQLDSFV
ncbi:hypothetical protein [Undibacterium fentianense]|uniref:DUF2975 domain-containing protein n=1 Tax=Undibacterium fentianense TaxID=2828728 RepID=A0A941E0Q1_9BURK|nr:hypothetical protein [Undibacterium fentianense]MBR7798524.1 hypothetical protein [Undibacterium fentianense]